MSEIGPRDVAPTWLWLGTAASGLLAVTAFFLGGAASVAVGPLAGLAVVGVTALLYRWGQVRERDADRDGDGDSTSRREREIEANNDGWS